MHTSQINGHRDGGYFIVQKISSKLPNYSFITLEKLGVFTKIIEIMTSIINTRIESTRDTCTILLLIF